LQKVTKGAEQTPWHEEALVTKKKGIPDKGTQTKRQRNSEHERSKKKTMRLAEGVGLCSGKKII